MNNHSKKLNLQFLFMNENILFINQKTKYNSTAYTKINI